MNDSEKLALASLDTELREQKLRQDNHGERRRRLGANLHGNEVVLVRRDDLEVLVRYAQRLADAEIEPDLVVPLTPAQDWLDWMDRHMPEYA
jgi:hypothetical protein